MYRCQRQPSYFFYLSTDPYSFNFLWGRGARGAQFKSCWGFGEEERLCSQRGMTATHNRNSFRADCFPPKRCCSSPHCCCLYGDLNFLLLCYLQITFHATVHLCLFVFQISVQLTKVLLHMENKYSINGFLTLRQATMVALTVTDCIPVWPQLPFHVRMYVRYHTALVTSLFAFPDRWLSIWPQSFTPWTTVFASGSISWRLKQLWPCSFLQIHLVIDLITLLITATSVIVRLFLFLVHQVLALAAQELSKPITEKRDPSMGIAASTDLTPHPDDKPVHWRQEVEKRIQSKTRRLRKVVAVDRHFFLPFWYLSEALQ